MSQLPVVKADDTLYDALAAINEQLGRVASPEQRALIAASALDEYVLGEERERVLAIQGSAEQAVTALTPMLDAMDKRIADLGEASETEAPDIKAPDIDLPEVKAPDVKLPDLDGDDRPARTDTTRKCASPNIGASPPVRGQSVSSASR